MRINLYTCKSNEKQLYLLKNPNSFQEGPVSNLQTRCVRADKGRKCVMLDECYFLSIKQYLFTIDYCFHNMWWLVKEPFLGSALV